jgi:hypothetical protein
MDQLKQMEKQLSTNQQATSALSTKFKDANAALQSKTAEAENYKRAADYATGSKKPSEGSTFSLKKGTYVHYSRNGGQEDSKGNSG